jgi:hypothetical protein
VRSVDSRSGLFVRPLPFSMRASLRPAVDHRHSSTVTGIPANLRKRKRKLHCAAAQTGPPMTPRTAAHNPLPIE